MFEHSCIKCRNTYSDTDPDDYYCPTCAEQKKAIAEKVDAILATRPRKNTMSALQMYDAQEKIRGFVNANKLQ